MCCEAPSVEIPENLRWLLERDDGRAWLDGLGTQVADIAEGWELELGPVYPGAFVSYACPAVTADGEPVVLKVQFPHEDCRTEAAALAAWDGRGAVRLLRHDPERWALLLERGVPGQQLAETQGEPETVLEAMAVLHEQTWVVPAADHPFATLQAHAHHWCIDMEERWEQGNRVFPRELIDLAITCLREVADDQGEQVIVNQDLHAENVISATREPWLVIDPKPLVGERELSLAALARSFGWVQIPPDPAWWVRRACERLDVDHDRALRWAIGQSVCWGMETPASAERHRWTVGHLVADLRARG